jgi:hypothetical protein
MDTKTIGNMALCASSNPTIEHAFEAKRGVRTHDGADTGFRKTLKWYKRTAHKADRRLGRRAIAESMEADVDVDPGSYIPAYMVDPTSTVEFFKQMDFDDEVDHYYENLWYCHFAIEEDLEVADFYVALRRQLKSDDLPAAERVAIERFVGKHYLSA